MKKRYGIIGLAISVVCLYFAFRGVDFAALGDAFSAARYEFLIPAMLLYFSGYVFRALRWQIMLEPLKPIRLKTLYHVVMIAWTANNLLPARLGEFIRAIVIGKVESISRSASFATIVLERVLDGITLIGALAILLLLHPFPAWVRSLGGVGTLLFLGGMVFLICLYVWREQTLRLFRRLTNWLPGTAQTFVVNGFEKFLSGLQFLRQKPAALKAFGYSIIIWSIEAVVYFIFMQMVGLDLPFYIAIFVLVIINMGIILPSSPGYVGTFQFFAVLALAVFGVPKSHALGFAFLLHGMIYLLVTGLGLLSMQMLGMRWGDLSKMEMETQENITLSTSDLEDKH